MFSQQGRNIPKSFFTKSQFLKSLVIQKGFENIEKRILIIKLIYLSADVVVFSPLKNSEGGISV